MWDLILENIQVFSYDVPKKGKKNRDQSIISKLEKQAAGSQILNSSLITVLTLYNWAGRGGVCLFILRSLEYPGDEGCLAYSK